MRIVIMDKRDGEEERELDPSELTEDGAFLVAALLEILAEEIKEREAVLGRDR